MNKIIFIIIVLCGMALSGYIGYLKNRPNPNKNVPTGIITTKPLPSTAPKVIKENEVIAKKYFTNNNCTLAEEDYTVIENNPPLSLKFVVPKNSTYEKDSENAYRDWGIKITTPSGIKYTFCYGCHLFYPHEKCGSGDAPWCNVLRTLNFNGISFEEYVYKDGGKLAYIDVDWKGDYRGDPQIYFETTDDRTLTNKDIKEISDIMSCITW